MSRTHYDVLQVSKDASADEIKEAYRALAWQSQSEGGQDRLKEINAAYAVLSSPARREEYDRALSAGEAPPLPAVSSVPKDSEAELLHTAGEAWADPAEGPGFHPFRILFGFACSISYGLSRIRYNFIPFNLVLGAVATVFLVTTVGNYLDAPANQHPVPASIEKVVNGQAKGYVSVAGQRSKEAFYTAEKDGKVVAEYYGLYMAPYLIMVRGKEMPASGTFTGMLRPMADDLQLMVRKDAASPANRNVRMATVLFLDTDYRPVAPYIYLLGMIGLGLAVLLLLLPPLFGYALFRRGTAAGTMPSTGGPAWPVRVLACGRFLAKETGRKGYEAFMPASLVRTGSPERPLEVWFDRFDKKGPVTYVLTIPAESTVEWGYAYGNGKAMPAVSFRSGWKRSLVTVPTERDARQIVALFKSGGLNS